MEPQTVTYTLLMFVERKCDRCNFEAEYILLGKENELLGFFCPSHGKQKQYLLENKYNFEFETKPKVIIKGLKKYKQNFGSETCFNCLSMFKKKRADHLFCCHKCYLTWRAKHDKTDERTVSERMS